MSVLHLVVMPSSTEVSFRSGNQAATIAPLVIGVVLLILAMVNEFYTKRSPIMPPRLFKACPVAISGNVWLF